ncbi:MAG TPA: molybdopterin molybdotransferase MoeA [Puia sp.]|jgi:molybdopterin molybdotransferase|nr:molybdopterin molybdotransferase MoeA [Puia sp.]
MIRVEEAEKIILQQCKDLGTESISFENCLGRVLAENIIADRDLPAFNRVTMDGIAIHYDSFKNGLRTFKIKATQSAGENPIEINNYDECIEIMTGAALPSTTDTIVPYEEIEIKNGNAIIKTETVTIYQNIHPKGKDKKQNQVLVEADQFITPAIIAIAATVGKSILQVKKNPSVIIISTGDELVDITETPTSFQLRRSNNYTLHAVLKQYSLDAEMLHLPDEQNTIENELKRCIDKNDIIILSGGVSMGKFDYVPPALEKLQVKKLFHKVQQRPGKPFWFGMHERGTLVFAFPGNPVSTFMCFHRYFLPWLKKSWGAQSNISNAILSEDFIFKPALQYFLQVKLSVNEKGEFIGIPVEGNGSGDFINLLQTDAFMELPLERTDFKKGEVFPIWVFKQIL